jgi:hypothetical protein
MAAEKKGGLFVEPMLTYERGEAEVDFPSPFGSSKSKVNGFGVGARLGIHVMESVFLGIDGRYSLPNYENNDTDIDSEATAYNYGPVIGIQMPTDIGLRVWAGYIMGGEMDVDKDQGTDLKFKEASGFRIGTGIKLASVSLNLEYQKITYDKTEVENPGLFSGSTNSVTQDNNSYILSVSFPISL